MTDRHACSNDKPETEIVSSVHFEEGITEIEPLVFENLTDIKTIVIPDSVTSIGIYAFSDCTSLTSIVIPDTPAKRPPTLLGIDGIH